MAEKSLVELLYGTPGAEALEKTAQARFIEKLAEEHQVDLSGLSDEEKTYLEERMKEELASTEEPTDSQEKLGAADAAYARSLADVFVQDVLQKLGAASTETAQDVPREMDLGDELLEDAVNARALEMLDENDYEVPEVLQKVASAGGIDASLQRLMAQGESTTETDNVAAALSALKKNK